MSDADCIRLEARAKVNLRLQVLAREDSGYHQIETLFCALELCDVVVVGRRAEGINLRVVGPEPGPPDDNLVYRAATAYERAAGLSQGIDIELHKRIPVGAGLGGGSSDAAATLRALDRLHGERLGTPRLLDLALALGSDVPFCLAGGPLALAWGRGERLLRLPPLPRRPVLVLMPGFGVPTAQAYAALAKSRATGHAPTPPSATAPDALASWAAVAAAARNDFEDVVFRQHPGLGEARDALEAAGAVVARLSGSGAALFGVFEDVEARDAARRQLAERHPSLAALPTWTAGA